MEAATLVTLESLLNPQVNDYHISSSTDLDVIMDAYSIHEHICILEQNMVAYEAAYNVECIEAYTIEHACEGSYIQLIALENKFTDTIGNIFKAIGEFFKKIWKFIVDSITNVINFFKGLGKKKETPKQKEITVRVMTNSLTQSDIHIISYIEENRIRNKERSERLDKEREMREAKSREKDKEKSEIYHKHDSSHATSAIPMLRKYAIAPEEILQTLITDMVEFVKKYENIAPDPSIICDPDKFTKIKNDFNALIFNTKIFGIPCGDADGEVDSTTHLFSGVEWKNAFIKKIFPDGEEKANITCVQAHITPNTLKYIRDTKFMTGLIDVKISAHDCELKYIKSIELYQKTIYDLADKADVNDHVGMSKLGTKYRPIAIDLQYFRKMSTSALMLLQLVWRHIANICSELRTLQTAIDKIVEAIDSKD
jgi:hypothetical protein